MSTTKRAAWRKYIRFFATNSTGGLAHITLIDEQVLHFTWSWKPPLHVVVRGWPVYQIEANKPGFPLHVQRTAYQFGLLRLDL